MVLVMAVLDMVGVASIMPFMAVLANPEVVETHRYLQAVYQRLGFSDTPSFLFFLGVVVFVALVVATAGRALTTYATVRFTQMRNYSLSRKLVAGYLGQPYEFFLNRHSADLGKSVLAEVEQVIGGALMPAINLVSHGAVALALLGLLIVLDPVLALTVTVVLGGAYGLIYLVLRRYLHRLGQDLLQANRSRFTEVQEAFGGIKDIKVLGLEGEFLQRFEGPANRYARTMAARAVVQQMPRFALEIVTFGGLLLVILYLLAGAGGLQQALPVIAVYAFAGYRLMPALQNIYSQAAALRFAGPMLDALHRDLVALDPAGRAALSRHRVAPLGLSTGLSLREIGYTYPGADRPVLAGLTLTVPARATVGLVGATGSGKTTLVDLILGLLPPEQGELWVDGQRLTAENRRAWQRTIGYVPQHIYLADASVAANIAFGVPEGRIDAAAVERAARIANLHEFVVGQLPRGYATTIGERGVRLSGGQRQRIGIARALYHDPELLILDEATSALDNLTEQAVMEAVRCLGHRKTIILIAHRLTTVRECDQIFLLENGRLEGQGTFEELTRQNTRFRAMAGAMG
ncbi:MAG: ABC transporter ATP-binding protein [Candidatus Competibacteraceae bacterium]